MIITNISIMKSLSTMLLSILALIARPTTPPKMPQIIMPLSIGRERSSNR